MAVANTGILLGDGLGATDLGFTLGCYLFSVTRIYVNSYWVISITCRGALVTFYSQGYGTATLGGAEAPRSMLQAKNSELYPPTLFGKAWKLNDEEQITWTHDAY